jgi:hypothetical protein
MMLARRSVFAFLLGSLLPGLLLAPSCSDGGGPASAGPTSSVASSGAGGAGGEDALPPLEVPEGCNPIAYANDCMLPYPTDFFLVDDPTTPTKKRVALTEKAQLRTASGDAIDFLKVHPADGFSRHMPIMAVFPEGVDTQNVTFHTGDLAATLKPESTTLLLDAATGEPVPHWAELDKNTEKSSEQAFFVRPLVSLKERTRYIVAFQGLKDKEGALIKAPSGFLHIREGKAAGDAVVGPIALRYEEEIFPALEKFGVARADLQLAWDFTTGSDEERTRDMLAVRDDLIAKFEAAPPAVTIDAVKEDVSEEIALRIEGTLKVPLYMETALPGALLHRDAAGKVAQNGEADVPFTLQVPKSALPADAAFEPARILQYGHGFFGLREEINYGFMRGFSKEQRYITVAVDWWGMSEPDIPTVTGPLLGDVSLAFAFTDRLHQGLANMIALSYAVKGPLAERDELKRFGKLLYDPAKLFYYGISQGAIFGVTLMALSPTLDRAALSVGGGPYSLMMSRSGSYRDLFALLDAALSTPLDAQKLIAMSQQTWDRVDPMTYSERIFSAPYPKSPADRRVLMQIGIGDHSVNNLASHMNARALGIPLLTPAPRAIFGLPEEAMPAKSGLVEVDFKLAKEPGVECRIPAEDEENDVHEGVRRNVKIKAQLDAFFQPGGMVENFCDGACDPE